VRGDGEVARNNPFSSGEAGTGIWGGRRREGEKTRKAKGGLTRKPGPRGIPEKRRREER